MEGIESQPGTVTIRQLGTRRKSRNLGSLDQVQYDTAVTGRENLAGARVPQVET